MRRSNRWLLLLAALLAMAFAPLPRAKAPSAKKELRRLQGEWAVVSTSAHGEKKEEPGVVEVIKGDLLTRHRPGRNSVLWTVAVGPSKDPRAMDLDNGEGLVIRCAYALSGDTLTVAYGDQETVKERPADLKPRKGVWVQVLKRKKPRTGGRT